ASLGTLMHSALENSAQGADPSSFVSEMWHTLEFESQWQERQAERQAAQMSLLLTDYLSSASELIASEEPFVIEIGGIEIRGKIDRIEKSETGMTVVDLKTGKRVPSGEDVAQNRQLAIYQLAVEQKYGSSSGAKIVSISSGRLREVSQPPVTDQLRQELEQLVGSIARGLESGSFTASVDEHCASDRSCTLLITPGVSGA
ncbi:MAG: PD-(D/E)XK nuclease family protein, partial [Aquiluna sp.]